MTIKTSAYVVKNVPTVGVQEFVVLVYRDEDPIEVYGTASVIASLEEDAGIYQETLEDAAIFNLNRKLERVL